MRRLSGVLLAGAILLLPAFSQNAFAQAPPQKTTYSGDMVILAYAINADKVGDYEKVIATLKDALSKSTKPEAKQQLTGWKIIKNSMPQPDGTIVYVHVISVVKDADYSITNIVYDVITDPMERTNFFNLYKGALNKALFAIQGPVVSDFSK
ncbi:MAG TPA: hypothetical protein VKB50_21245 [Vicinamibacterales bacterium]|nr:hypothetical protein [Vicinamibacterales bacterium]